MEPTIRIQSRLGKRRQRKRADSGVGSVRAVRAVDGTPGLQSTASLARRLALAHCVERLIDDGKLRNYAQAAAVLGITRARVSQLADLALLSAHIQEQVLALEAVDGAEPIAERTLRVVAHAGTWAEQGAAWAKLSASGTRP